MNESRAENIKVVAASLAGIAVFAVIGVLIYKIGSDDDAEVATDSTRVTTTIETTSTTTPTTEPTTESTTEPTPTTEESPVEDDTLVVEFPAADGLGFITDRVWRYDPDTRTLENTVTLNTEIDQLAIAYGELLPASLSSLGDFTFDPEPVSSETAGSVTIHRFDLTASPGSPGTMRWTVVTVEVLDQRYLDALAAQRDAAEFG